LGSSTQLVRFIWKRKTLSDHDFIKLLLSYLFTKRNTVHLRY